MLLYNTQIFKNTVEVNQFQRLTKRNVCDNMISNNSNSEFLKNEK